MVGVVCVAGGVDGGCVVSFDVAGVLMVAAGGVAGGGVTFAGDVWSDPVGFSFTCCSWSDCSQFGWWPSVHFQAG